MGSLMRIFFSIGSIVSLGEYLAVYISNSVSRGDMKGLNVLSLLLCVLITLLTMYRASTSTTRETKRQTEIAHKHVQRMT